MLRINADAHLPRALDPADPVRVLDVGAHGGSPPELAQFPSVDLIGFEPDPEEASRLTAAGGGRYIPTALGARAESRQLRITRFPPGSGLYNSADLFAGTENERSVELVRTETINVERLDDFAARERLQAFDFIKIDAELAELDIIEGGRNTISQALAVELEVHFPKRPPSAGCFAEVDEAMREMGFELYDLDVYRFARVELPSPPIYDYRGEHGEAVPGPTVEGQALTGDALYFRTAPDPDRVLKHAALLELHRLPDCAAALLDAHSEVPGAEQFRRLLAANADGLEALDGRRYGPNYHVFEELWQRQSSAPTEHRPTPAKEPSKKFRLRISR